MALTLFRWQVLGAAIASLSCAGISTTEEERRVGIIEASGAPLTVSTPDSVDRGVPFVVEVRTYGNSCTQVGDTEVTIEGRRAEVTPYDLWDVQGTCRDIQRFLTHRITLEFWEQGPATLGVIGRSEPTGAMVEREFSVFVR